MNHLATSVLFLLSGYLLAVTLVGAETDKGIEVHLQGNIETEPGINFKVDKRKYIYDDGKPDTPEVEAPVSKPVFKVEHEQLLLKTLEAKNKIANFSSQLSLDNSTELKPVIAELLEAKSKIANFTAQLSSANSTAQFSRDNSTTPFLSANSTRPEVRTSLDILLLKNKTENSTTPFLSANSSAQFLLANSTANSTAQFSHNNSTGNSTAQFLRDNSTTPFLWANRSWRMLKSSSNLER